MTGLGPLVVSAFRRHLFLRSDIPVGGEIPGAESGALIAASFVPLWCSLMRGFLNSGGRTVPKREGCAHMCVGSIWAGGGVKGEKAVNPLLEPICTDSGQHEPLTLSLMPW